jgi:hypothetical protein
MKPYYLRTPTWMLWLLMIGFSWAFVFFIAWLLFFIWGVVK